jgi:hypothetical protein
MSRLSSLENLRISGNGSSNLGRERHPVGVGGEGRIAKGDESERITLAPISRQNQQNDVGNQHSWANQREERGRPENRNHHQTSHSYSRIDPLAPSQYTNGKDDSVAEAGTHTAVDRCDASSRSMSRSRSSSCGGESRSSSLAYSRRSTISHLPPSSLVNDFSNAALVEEEKSELARLRAQVEQLTLRNRELEARIRAQDLLDDSVMKM